MEKPEGIKGVCKTPMQDRGVITLDYSTPDLPWVKASKSITWLEGELATLKKIPVRSFPHLPAITNLKVRRKLKRSSGVEFLDYIEVTCITFTLEIRYFRSRH